MHITPELVFRTLADPTRRGIFERLASGGEQTVRVEHVTVNEGGQAIVGNVSRG